MCKELNLTLDGKRVKYTPFSDKTGPDDLVRRPGKTKRDHESGAHANHLQNREAKAEENRDWAGTERKGGKASR